MIMSTLSNANAFDYINHVIAVNAVGITRIIAVRNGFQTAKVPIQASHFTVNCVNPFFHLSFQILLLIISEK